MENCFNILKYNTTAYQNYYQYETITMLNELVKPIKLINDKVLFKNGIKKNINSRKIIIKIGK